MMFTKKTRLVSGLVAILMLISMFTAFVLPAVAAPFVNDWDQYEVTNSTGLTNLSTLDDIKNYTTGTPMFKVTDAEGIFKIAELVNNGTNLSGVSIYQTNDIDMNWEPFAGIGGYFSDTYYPFSGTFNGNGFIIENLYVLRNSDNASAVGLFGAAVNATLKNIGIASGLVVGSRKVGAIVGYAENTSVENCWNAATVVGGSDQGTAGIAGYVVDALLENSTASKAKVVNSYNVGLIFNREATASGIVGFIDTEDITRATGAYVANCYNAGEIVTGMNGYNSDPHLLQGNSVIVGGNYLYGFGECTNNYYVRGHGKADLSIAEFSAANNGKFEDGFIIASTDGAAGVDTAAELADAISANMSVTDTGYNVVYEYTDAGYPAIAYKKNGSTIIRRVAHTSSNVCENTWAENSDLFAKVSAGRDGAWALASGTKLNDLEIATANDLFVLGLIASFGSYKSTYGNGNITITAHIDMAEMDLCPVAYFVPIASGTAGGSTNTSAFDGTLDGGNHIIKNWKYLANIHGGSANGGLISYGYNCTVKNLGLVDVYGVYDRTESATGKTYTYASTLVERGYGNFTINNCYVEGAMSVTDDAANANNYGGLFSTFWNGATPNISDCWSDVTLIRPDADNATSKIRPIGKVPVKDMPISNCFYISDEEPEIIESENLAKNECIRLTSDYSTADGSLAAYMNEFTARKWGCYDGATTFAKSNDEAVYLLKISKLVGDYEASVELYQYKAGSTVQLPVVEGYELDTSRLYLMPTGVETGTVTMPGRTLTLYYQCTAPDYSILEDIIAKYESFDFSYFRDTSDLEELLLLAQETVDHKDIIDPAVGMEIINRVIAGEQNMNLELASTYPNYPKMKDYDIYAQYNATNNWAISDLEDWQAVVALANADSSSTLIGYSFHLISDVDLKNIAINPIHPSKTDYNGFAGTIDGHGYAFKNMNMNRNLADGHCVALVGYGNGCVIKNLGIANGTIKASGSNSAEHFVAAFCGEANNASITNCWNGATVDATGATTNNQSVSGIARLNGSSVMDNCFNIGLVTGNGMVGVLSGATHKCNIYNSFAVVYSVYSNMKGTKFMTRFSAGYLASNSSNMYMIGNYNDIAFDYNMGDLDRTAFILEANAYETGEIAWKINSTYEGKGYRPYYTIDKNGKVTFGNESNQARRITYKVDGEEAGYAYVAGGSEYKLNYKLGSQYKLAAGSAGTITNGVLSVPDADVVIDVTLSNYNYDSLSEALDLYTDGIYPYLKNGEDVKDLVNRVNNKIADGSYTSQDEIAADAQALKNAFVYAGYPNLPSIEDYSKYPEVPGYLVGTLEELEALVSVKTSLTADQTIYLTDDITVTAKSAANSMGGLKASIDGKGHAIKGVTITESINTAWLDAFGGSFIQDLTLEDWTVTTNAESGMLMTTATGDLTLTNITVKNCKANGGFLVGRVNNAKLVAENLYLNNNTVGIINESGNGGRGVVFGEMNTAAGSTIKNVAVLNTTYMEGNGLDGVLIGRQKSGDISVDNVIVELDKDHLEQPVISVDGVDGSNTYTPTLNYSNIYTNATNLVRKRLNTGESLIASADEGAYVTTDEMERGAAAYLLNNAGVGQKWEIKDDTIVFDTDGEGLPVEITFQLRDGTTYAKFYTDVEGYMVNFTEEFFNSKEWNGYTSYTELANKVFEEPATITQSECQHVWGEYISKGGTHYRECIYECGATTVNEPCAYGEYTYNSNNDTHSRICNDCGYLQMGTCDYGKNEWVGPFCDSPNELRKTCNTCRGYKVIQTGNQAPLGHTWDSWEHDDSTENEASKHTQHCNVCGVDKLVDCEFDDGFYYEHSTGVYGYTLYTCADCGYEYKMMDTEYRHDYNEEEGKIVKTPSYITDEMTEAQKEACKGKFEVPCKYCDTVTYQDIPALTGTGIVVDAPANVTPGSTFTVALELINNVGVAALNVAVSYDSTKLKLKNVEARASDSTNAEPYRGEFFEYIGGAENFIDDGDVTFSFISSANVEGDQEFAYLTFEASENIGDTMISASIKHTPSYYGRKDGALNEKGEEIEVGGSSALITVSNRWGDADMDGDVDVIDAIHVMRYMAGRVEENAIDLIAANADAKNNKITLGDAILILRYVAGFYTPAL